VIKTIPKKKKGKQVSLEASKVVWYSHFLKNFPRSKALA